MTDIIPVDYTDTLQLSDLLHLLKAYALDPMGGGEALSDDVLSALPDMLAAQSGALSFIAYDEGKAVGLINCFSGFSTFAARPLLNIHDVYVAPNYRGRGICTRLLEAVAAEARQRGCCKLTLEVLSGNEAARQAYRRAGFDAYQLDPEQGAALFWQRLL